MPVFKFRSVEDMPGETWRRPGDPALYRALASLWDTHRRLQRHRFPPGVWKHRTLADMDRQRDEWARPRVNS